MCRGTRNPQKFKVIFYAYSTVELNEYLIVFPGGKGSENVGEMELNKIILNIIPNGCSKKEYVQGFDC